MSYNIILPQFEGPFDLLLFFIERDELDIYDIPIHKLTDDFLAYIRQMEVMNIDVASEFILVAATLMRIKARMLLPKKEVDEEGNEIDPRQELIQKLIDYKRFKDISRDLEEMEQARGSRLSRGNVFRESRAIAESFSTESELESLSLYKLMQVFQKVLTRFDEKNRVIQHTIIKYDYTIAGQKDFIRKFFRKNSSISFEHVIEKLENRVHAIFTFLAILEMVQLNDLLLQTGDGYNNFWLSTKDQIN